MGWGRDGVDSMGQGLARPFLAYSLSLSFQYCKPLLSFSTAYHDCTRLCASFAAASSAACDEIRSMFRIRSAFNVSPAQSIRVGGKSVVGVGWQGQG